MTLHLLCGRWWKILCPPYGTICNVQKGCITRAVHGPMMALTYTQWYTRLPVVKLMQVTEGLPAMFTIAEVLT